MAETNGKLAEFRNLSENLFSDEMNTSMLWPKVDFGLEPAGADLDAAIGGGHDCAGTNDAQGKREEEIRAASSSTLMFDTRWNSAADYSRWPMRASVRRQLQIIYRARRDQICRAFRAAREG